MEAMGGKGGKGKLLRKVIKRKRQRALKRNQAKKTVAKKFNKVKKTVAKKANRVKKTVAKKVKKALKGEETDQDDMALDSGDSDLASGPRSSQSSRENHDAPSD